ncbi:hypothetical protein [Dactylosporangium sp. CA-092794]|uniref:hypothetical protein n=1 Tax=Dactylosporangium sp. CA-092794 TaxID=3239929 RepID=UPI003D931D94
MIDELAALPTMAPAPRPHLSMMSMPVPGPDGEPVVLWCDPLTGLIAYPSFANYLTEQLPQLVPAPVHLAIGDVDDLKEYVSQRRAEDPTCFGHLAGNACMQALGSATRQWAERTFSTWPFALCGTFGGDEVIIAAAGRGYDEFVADIHRLIEEIRQSVPRTCSFSTGTLTVRHINPGDQEQTYRHFVSQVDAALFLRKAVLRQADISPRGDFADIGAVTFDPAPARPPGAPGGARQAADSAVDQAGVGV